MEQLGIPIELGGAVRHLSLDLNATIALQGLTGEEIGPLLRRLIGAGDKAAEPGETPEDRSKRVAQQNKERLKAIRLVTWALLASDCPEFEDDPSSLSRVGRWITIDKMQLIPPAIEALLLGQKGAQEFDGQLAPYVPTPIAVVERMVDLAELKDGDEVIDLGAGDGRLLFASADRANVQCFGIEQHDERYKALQARVKEHKHGDRIFLQREDIRKASLNGCNVVYLYLLQASNAELKEKLLTECKPGARVISHDFSMPDWEPEQTVRVECDDRPHTLYLWRVPVRP